MRLRIARTLARLHLIGALKPVITKGPPFTYSHQHPPEARRRMWRQLMRPAAYETALEEYAELEDRTGPGDLEAMGDFPRVPLALLMHDPEVMIGQFVKLARLPRADGERVEALWGELLRDHAALSPLARAETVPGCGHLIHLEAPNLTVAAIASLVRDQPRASDPPPPDSKRPTGPWCRMSQSGRDFGPR